MSAIGFLLWVFAIYYTVGIVLAIRFVFFVAPRIDPVYQGAPFPVRLLFFPGAVAVWPATIKAQFLTKDKVGDKHES